MIAPLSHMAGAMTPAMFRYVRSYIRFLLPRKDQPLDALLRQLRLARPDEQSQLEQKLREKFSAKQLNYLLNRLWCLFEEVLLSPLQPWNEEIHQNTDLAIQRKLLGGMRLASYGLVEPAHHCFKEVVQAVESGQSQNLALKIQASLYTSPENSMVQVNDKAGNLVDEYLSVMEARKVLNDVLSNQILLGLEVPDHLTFRVFEFFPEVKLASAIVRLLRLAYAGRIDELRPVWSEIQKYVPVQTLSLPFIESTILARVGIILCSIPQKFPYAAHWLNAALKFLPIEHPLYPDVFRYRFQLLVLEGKTVEAERVLRGMEKRPQMEKRLWQMFPMMKAILAFLRNDQNTALQQMMGLPFGQYSDSSVRIFELFHYLKDDYSTITECRLEAFRKLLARKGEKESRSRLIHKLMIRLNSNNCQFRSFQKQQISLLTKLEAEFPWTPATGEWFPFEVWYSARLHGKPLVRTSQAWMAAYLPKSNKE